MSKRLISFTCCGAVIVLLVWWLLRGTAPQMAPAIGPQSIKSNPVASNVMPILPSAAPVSNIVRTLTRVGPGLHLFRSTNYPPQTAGEIAMWKWWDAMDKADPEFQWKMPIEFYGKVVDQFGEPVSDARVNFVWTTVIGPVPDPKRTVMSGSDGRFKIKGIQGKGISVDILKDGYTYTRNSHGSFEYAAFYQDNFHVPDPNNPVIFRLQKLMGAEPMYVFQPYGNIAPDGSPLLLDIPSGKIAANGDISFSVQFGDKQVEDKIDYTLTIRAQNGAGFVVSQEEFAFNAPESGYQKEMTIRQNITDTNYNRFQNFHFYAKTRNDKYSMVAVEISVPRNPGAIKFDSTIYYNPSGSRNWNLTIINGLIAEPRMGIYKTSINLLAVSLLVLAACSPRPSAVRDALPKPPVVNSTVIPSKVVYFPDPQGLQSVRLFKSTNYPPHTVEEKAMWEWYDAMEKADESWQWKMPIEFYGKVIDQFSNPVVGAEVVLNWTTVIGPIPDPKKTIFTDTDGRFEIKGIQGKGISIFVYGEGYDRTHDR